MVARTNEKREFKKSACSSGAWKVGFAEFPRSWLRQLPSLFRFLTNEKRLSIEAVARRASFAEGVEGGEKPPLSRSAERETPHNPKGAPKKVNCITVRWTVIQEENPCDRGIFLVSRPQALSFKCAGT